MVAVKVRHCLTFVGSCMSTSVVASATAFSHTLHSLATQHADSCGYNVHLNCLLRPLSLDGLRLEDVERPPLRHYSVGSRPTARRRELAQKDHYVEMCPSTDMTGILIFFFSCSFFYIPISQYSLGLLICNDLPRG